MNFEFCLELVLYGRTIFLEGFDIRSCATRGGVLGVQAHVLFSKRTQVPLS